ncbi:MAG: type II toxin-antitoxin system YafQ family toxin, partial [Bifidobacterium adolescentis]
HLIHETPPLVVLAENSSTLRKNKNMTLISQALHLAVARMATHPKTLEELHRRHNMHTLSGNWRVRYECHVANAGDWLVIWSSNDSVAFFERTGSHDELFR